MIHLTATCWRVMVINIQIYLFIYIYILDFSLRTAHCNSSFATEPIIVTGHSVCP